MKKTDMDFLVGASIIVAAVILIAGVLWLKEVSVSRKMVNYAVLFPNVGTLQIGDPVMVNGVSNGSVKHIYLRKSDVAVILELDKSVPVTDSCKIIVQNIGLMGERGIGLRYSTEGSIVRPLSSQGDTIFLYGSFDTGIAEAMGMLGSVMAEVEDLVGNVSTILDQTVGDTSFFTLFKKISGRLDTISLLVEGMVVDNKAVLERSVHNLETLSNEAHMLIKRNAPMVDTIFSDGRTLASRALNISENIDTLMVTAQSVLNRLHDEETTAGKLLNDKKLYNDLTRTLTELDSLVKDVRKDALKLRVKIGFGKKRN